MRIEATWLVTIESQDDVHKLAAAIKRRGWAHGEVSRAIVRWSPELGRTCPVEAILRDRMYDNGLRFGPGAEFDGWIVFHVTTIAAESGA